jgi:hypothetical protein
MKDNKNMIDFMKIKKDVKILIKFKNFNVKVVIKRYFILQQKKFNYFI